MQRLVTEALPGASRYNLVRLARMIPADCGWQLPSSMMAVEGTGMSNYGLLNWFFCLSTAGILLHVAIKQKSLLVKPTMIVLAFFNVKIQWAAAINSDVVQADLVYPWEFLLLAQVFPFVSLVLSLGTFRNSSAWVFRRITSVTDRDFATLPKRPLRLMMLMIGIITAWYLSVVPLQSTGLYAIIFDPLASDEARERSLSTAGGMTFRYMINVMLAVLYPVFATLFVFRTRARQTDFGFLSNLILFISVVAVLVAVTLTGERSRSVILLLTLGVANFFHKRASVKPIQIALLMGTVLLIPAVLTVLRHGESVTFENLWTFYPYIFDRAMSGPMKTGVAYLSYVQTNRYFGVAGIPKLATLFGVEPINVPNFMGLMHEGDAIESVGMNTSFVFFYHSCFGLGAFIPSMILLLLLDFAVLVYSRIQGPYLIACVATTSLLLTKLTDTNYTTVIATHGFLVSLALCYYLGRSPTGMRSRPLPTRMVSLPVHSARRRMMVRGAAMKR